MQMEQPMELGDVMYTVSTAEDVKNNQKVSLFRNGDQYTVFIADTTGRDYRYERRILDREAAMKLYMKIVRAFVTGMYSWETRSGWVRKAAGAT